MPRTPIVTAARAGYFQPSTRNEPARGCWRSGTGPRGRRQQSRAYCGLPQKYRRQGPKRSKRISSSPSATVSTSRSPIPIPRYLHTPLLGPPSWRAECVYVSAARARNPCVFKVMTKAMVRELPERAFSPGLVRNWHGRNTFGWDRRARHDFL